MIESVSGSGQNAIEIGQLGHGLSRNKEAKVVAGFPGVGKSHFYTKNNKNLKVLDSDSTTFSKLSDKKTPNPAWPKNYIDHIKDNMDKVDLIFVSTHKDTRSLLAENKIAYTLVYPNKNLKPEYMERYRNRKSPDFLIHMLDKNWTNFVEECEAQTNCRRLELKSGEFIGDVSASLLSDDRKPAG